MLSSREKILRKAPFLELLRVVTLEDGETVHNAFPDRNFEGPAQ